MANQRKPIDNNPHMNQQQGQQQMMNMNPYLMNNQQQMQNMQRMNQMDHKQPDVNPSTPLVDNIDLVNKLNKIMLITGEEKKEIMGECLFYYLLEFISTYNLNTTNGVFDDAILCSKLTGIFLHTDEKELLEIVCSKQVLALTIRDVIKVN